MMCGPSSSPRPTSKKGGIGVSQLNSRGHVLHWAPSDPPRKEEGYAPMLGNASATAPSGPMATRGQRRGAGERRGHLRSN